MRESFSFSINAQAYIWHQDQQSVQSVNSAVIARIKQRDNHTCCFCGHKSFDNIVHHLDHNHTNHDPDNLITICDICHQHQHLEEATSSQHVCYLPQLNTVDVIHFIRALYSAIRQGNERALELLEWLTSHSEYTDLSYTTSLPKELAEALHQTPPNLQSNIHHVFQHLYLVNTKDHFTNHPANEAIQGDISAWQIHHQSVSNVIF